MMGVAAFGAIACADAGSARASSDQSRGRLRARPGRPSTSPAQPFSPGEQHLAIGTDRDGLLYVPRDLPADTPLPLLVLLHGATGSAKGITTRVNAAELADRLKIVVLAPDSREGTWDVVVGGFGPDVAFLDTALARVFARVAIDPKHVAIGGFSDGASYALSLGLLNGDLFTHVIAFSPGFLSADRREGHPDIFISHGTHDTILRIDTTSRRLAPALQQAGYDVRYREFDGPHTVPAQIATEAFAWMLGKSIAAAAGAR
jgi:phospholipase/carboxylesterase